MTSAVRLDDLISAITENNDSELDRLTDAVLLADRLGEVADHLIGHFVDQARRAGASWTEIGRSLGVSKQAAQKRFVPGPDPSHGFGRYSDPARRVLVEAQDAARRPAGRRSCPGTSCWPCCRSRPGRRPGSWPATGCAARRCWPRCRRARPVRRCRPARGAPAAPPVFGPRARKVLELTFRQALRLGHDGVGTGHLLLALVEQEAPDGLLRGLGVTGDGVEPDPDR